MAKELLLQAAVLFAACEIFCFFLVAVLQPFKKGQTSFLQDLAACGKLAILFGGMIILPIIMVIYLVSYTIDKVKGTL